MIVDIYNYFKHHPKYNKLIGDDYLLVEYKCPLNVDEFKLWSEFHLITYVINGRKDWITQSITYKIRAGDSLFIRRGIYTTKQYLEEEYCVLLFFMNDNFIKRFIGENPQFYRSIDAGKNYSQVFQIHTSETFHNLIVSIFLYLKQAAHIPRNLVELKFRELLFNIAMNPLNTGIVEFFNSVSNSAKVDIEDIMMKHFQADLSTAEFARLCGRSLSTFKRDFSKHFNTTPAKWLISKRLEYAQTLIIGTDLNMNEICYESGFKNNSHFVSAFKNKFKLPPHQFKAKYMNK